MINAGFGWLAVGEIVRARTLDELERAAMVIRDALEAIQDDDRKQATRDWIMAAYEARKERLT
jgi:hypothetical protein